MLKFFVLALLAISCQGGPVQDDQEESPYAAAFIKANHYENNMLPPELCQPENVKVTFTLYTRENPHGDQIDLQNAQTLKDSSFNVKRDTKVLIHEWLQNETHSYAVDFVSAFLKYKVENVNIMVVDYSSVSRCDFKLMRDLEPVIAEQVGNLLKKMINYGSVPSMFHLIGLGMGSHIAGMAARHIHPRKVGRLTALDPTFIGYLNNKPQLISNDSDYMDVIHTAQRKVDLVKGLGNARFFPNGGTRQALAVGQTPLDAGVLSHLAAGLFYLESIVDITYFKARLCPNYAKFLFKQCPEPAVMNNMGDEVNIKVPGDFYLTIPSAVPPFGNRVMVYKEITIESELIVKVRGVVVLKVELIATLRLKYEKKRYEEKKYTLEDVKNYVNEYYPKSLRSA